MANEQKIIATAGLISVGVGTANSLIKYEKPPTPRFLIGSGLAFLILSAMAASEATAEIAKGLALGVMTTILLGEGGGVLSYFAGERELNTQKPAKQSKLTNVQQRDPEPAHLTAHMMNPKNQYKLDVIPPQAGIPPTVNIIHG